MSQLVRAFSFIAFAALSAPALAESPPEAMPKMECFTWGHDVILYNRDDKPLMKGTEIHWSVWGNKRRGIYTVETELLPDIGHYLMAALGASYWDLRPCQAVVVSVPDGAN